MTVIAYRDGILATDTLVVSNGSRHGNVVKIERVEGWLIGGAGCLGVNIPVRKWILDGANLDEAVDFGKIEDSCVLMIHPSGKVYSVDTHSTYVLEDYAEFFAIGSGGEAARGAMMFGATAAQAVDAAKKIDIGCGGSTLWLSLDKKDNVELPKEIYKTVN